MTEIPNHYGYGLRNDELPYAHKVPPGGNWRSLPRDDQIAFMKGAFGSNGGKVGYLRRESWDSPAMTVLSAPMAKATCQLHPGINTKRSDVMTYNIAPQLASNGLTVAELFAGGGLMAVGLRAAGYDLIYANDFDKSAVKAYRHNLGDHIVHGDITTLDIDGIPDADVIAGGPPCQDYSVAGTGAGEDGERGKLVWRYLEIIKRKRPKAFVFENVKGLVTVAHKPTFFALIVFFDQLLYNVSWQLVNAWDYGVAQKRERVIAVGMKRERDTEEHSALRKELLALVSNIRIARELASNADLMSLKNDYVKKRLQAKQRDYIRKGDVILEKMAQLNKHVGPAFEFPEPRPEDYRTQVLRDVIGDLPEPVDTCGRNVKKAERVADMDEPAPVITTQFRCQTVQITNHNEKSYWTPKSEYTYDQANRVQSMDGPCNTIPAHHNSGQPIHPTQAPRRFTVRECLRIQSVPDSYMLPDDISLSAQYRIVGNGVASRVSYLLGVALAEQLRAATESSAIGERLISDNSALDCANGPEPCEQEAV